eukprot:433759-Rhodomonas_salina.2
MAWRARRRTRARTGWVCGLEKLVEEHRMRATNWSKHRQCQHRPLRSKRVRAVPEFRKTNSHALVAPEPRVSTIRAAAMREDRKRTDFTSCFVGSSRGFWQRSLCQNQSLQSWRAGRQLT